jgi:hypothetical protein
MVEFVGLLNRYADRPVICQVVMLPVLNQATGSRRHLDSGPHPPCSCTMTFSLARPN